MVALAATVMVLAHGQQTMLQSKVDLAETDVLKPAFQLGSEADLPQPAEL
jgi:FlaG/FlaF family flagellin (archaellin)